MPDVLQLNRVSPNLSFLLASRNFECTWRAMRQANGGSIDQSVVKRARLQRRIPEMVGRILLEIMISTCQRPSNG